MIKYILCKCALIYLTLALRMFDKSKTKHIQVSEAISSIKYVLFETESE